jgi:hypothetical protein
MNKFAMFFQFIIVVVIKKIIIIKFKKKIRKIT